MPAGETFVEKRDGARLKSQLARVVEAVCDPDNKGRKWTLATLGAVAGCPEASASARLRELRGLGFTVRSKFVMRGLHTYEVEPPL